MAHCCVVFCTSNWRRSLAYRAVHNKDLHFHKFPSDLELKKQWIVAIGRDEGPTFAVTKHTSVCSAHFKDDDYTRTFGSSKRRILKLGVVPSVFPQTKEKLQRKLLKQRTATSASTGSASSSAMNDSSDNSIGIAYSTRGSAWCSANNCTNARKKNRNLSFFSFPKDFERCKRWVLATGREDLLNKSTAYLNANCTLCANHFETSQFMNAAARNKLISSAVPSIFTVPISHRLLEPNGKLPVQRSAMDTLVTKNAKLYKTNVNATLSEHSYVRMERVVGVDVGELDDGLIDETSNARINDPTESDEDQRHPDNVPSHEPATGYKSQRRKSLSRRYKPFPRRENEQLTEQQITEAAEILMTMSQFAPASAVRRKLGTKKDRPN